jgi:Putative 2OG-Fe(II) oxygenase
MAAGERDGTERKTRSLKKYEAEAVAHLADGEAPPLELFSPFGPMIAKAEVPAELVARINRFADRHVREPEGSEFLLPPELVRDGGEASLARQTERLIGRYVRRLEGVAAARIRLDAFWVVSQYAGTPSPVHFHSGDISGVMYLKVPDIRGHENEEQKTYISGRQAGYINFLIGGKQRFSRSLISFKPRVADFYVFPGWLLHGAEPFRGAGERRSLAFNAFVDLAES